MKRTTIIKRAVIFLISAVILFTSCNNSDENYSSQMYSMDTYMTLTAYGSGSKAAVKKCEDEIARLDRLLSISEQDSDIYRINDNAGQFVEVSEETVDLIELCQQISERTDGLFDITSGVLSRLWGFRSGEHRVPTEQEISAALENVDYRKIEIDGSRVKIPVGMQLDLGAIGKGYASQRTHDIFTECGIGSAIVSLGGNVQLCGKKQDGSNWRIAIRHPVKPDDSIAVLSISDQAVVTSGGYQRYFDMDGKRYHHIFNAKTGSPAESGIISSTVICSDGAAADGLSTAMYLLGADGAVEYYKKYGGFDMILVCGDGSVLVTDGVADAVELLDDGYKMTVVGA